MFLLSAAAKTEEKRDPQDDVGDQWAALNKMTIKAWKRHHLSLTDNSECKDEQCKCATCRCIFCRSISSSIAVIDSKVVRDSAVAHLNGVCSRLQSHLRKRALGAKRQTRFRINHGTKR
jgi:hypothetical protein